MRLTDDTYAMLAGEAGLARQWAIEYRMHVGRDAVDSDHVSQAHIIADTGSKPTVPRLLDER